MQLQYVLSNMKNSVLLDTIFEKKYDKNSYTFKVLGHQKHLLFQWHFP